MFKSKNRIIELCEITVLISLDSQLASAPTNGSVVLWDINMKTKNKLCMCSSSHCNVSASTIDTCTCSYSIYVHIMVM